ncbi:unnamed protein product [Rotaria sordida]|uniref:Uncharacterized protein n=1 Tax=Rotaria sordida TaxID=392033 RepID=A0A819TDE0_9BILA|nr:unnamed protein product [Rotaria sordida]
MIVVSFIKIFISNNCLYSNDSPFARLLKQQITYLHLSFSEDSLSISTIDLSKNVYAKIFALVKKLTTLIFGNSTLYQCPLSLHNIPSNMCHSSILLILSITVSTFDEYLALLDGRLSQLSTFIVAICHIDHSSLLIGNTMILPNLKVFSLKSYQFMYVYDNEIVPLLRRMPNLEKLSLCLVKNRGTFIDGNHLQNEILTYMPRLDTFIFYIHTNNTITNEAPLQTNEDIQRSFINSKWSQIRYLADYFHNGAGISNIFSLPFITNYMDGITNSFLDGTFPTVNDLSMIDVSPFEHDFFKLIAQAFPSLRKLMLINRTPQIRKQQHNELIDNNNDQNSSVIVYPHLKTLCFFDVHIDYVEEFLHENNTHLSSLTQLQIKYEHLAIVTNHFTNNKTRLNCAHT